MPSITGLEASGPILPRPSTAEPLEIDCDQIGAGGVVGGRGRIVLDCQAGRGDTRRIGKREVALVAKRLRRLDFQLSRRWMPVEVEGGLIEVGALGLIRFDVHPGAPCGFLRSCANPKFVLPWSEARIEFRIKATLATYLNLVWFMDLKFLNADAMEMTGTSNPAH